jgi:glucose-1-phosphate thymidylyltransferase
MKGVILAGGYGTRLMPLTRVTNKHLLPVYDKPMIYYPIQCLVNAGIKQIMIVTGGNCAGDFLELLGNGKEFGLRELHYAYQEGAGGIAAALALTEDFVDGDKTVIVLGDNVIQGNIRDAVADFSMQAKGGRILLKKVPDPQRFGVAEVDSEGKVLNIQEKPKEPRSNLAVVGIYMYDDNVFDIIRGLKPSGRGELEITDVNNHYIQQGTMKSQLLEGWWTDAGTIKSLYKASVLVARDGANNLKFTPRDDTVDGID